MEPVGRPPPPLVAAGSRLALPVAAAGLVALTFAQAPGRLVADTKLDLVTDPAGFLGRAFHLWSPEAAMGYVPNQLAGYLFPMGPFHLLGHLAHLPGWVVQRLWFAALLVTGLVGVVRLARALRIGTEGTRLVGALAYVLAPAVAALAGTTAHLLPAVLLPWALLPLVTGSRRGSPRRAAAGSALAVAAMGGVNAAVVLAVLPAPGLWLLTRRRGQRHRLVGWWALGLVLATAWWVIPLLFQARYGFAFIPFTEPASVTTGATSATEVLRGGGSWLSFLVVSGPWAQGAWVTAALPAAVLAGAAVAAGGLYGLARRDCPERRTLGLILLVGFAAMTAGYAGALGGPLAGPVRDALDGGAAPFRNVGKFWPLVRLPLALGLAHGLSEGLASARLRRRDRAAAVLVALVAIMASCAPFARGQLYSAGSFAAVPGWWEEAARWLDGEDAGGRTLLVPGAPFGEYTWGRPLDEPIAGLAGSAWAVRDLIPLGSAGGIRALDAVERVLESGVGSPGLAPYLERMGVRHLVVRNDLDWQRSLAPRPVQMRRVLATSPGLQRVARFGPPLDEVRPLLTGDDVLWAQERDLRAIEVYAVAGAPGPVSAYPATSAVEVAGAPEALPGLLGRGVLDPTAPVVLAGPGAAGLPATTTVVTDSLIRRDVAFGLVRRNASYPLAPGEESPHSGAPPEDYGGAAASRTEVEHVGGRPEASTYGSFVYRISELGPGAAFDGNPATSWVSGAPSDHRGQWLQVRFDEARDLRTVELHPLADGPWRPVVREVEITTEQGTVREPLLAQEGPVAVEVASGPTRFLRLTFTAVEARQDPTASAGAGLRELVIPGFEYERWLVTPEPGAGAQVFAFTSPVERSTLLLGTLGDEEPVMRRRFEVARPANFEIAGEAVVRPGPERDRLLLSGPPSAEVVLPCGEGPSLSLDRRTMATTARGIVDDVAGYRPLRLEACDPPWRLAAGGHRLAGDGDPRLAVTALTLTERRLGPAAPSSARHLEVERWSRSARSVSAGPGGETVLAVHENANPGWEAHFEGGRLAPVTLDGWQQGFVIPAGEAGSVSLRYTPDAPYRRGLLAGVAALALLLGLALAPGRAPGRVPGRAWAAASPAPDTGRPLLWSVLGTGAVAVAGGPVALAVPAARLLPQRVLPWVSGAALAAAGVVAARGAGAFPGSGAGEFSSPAQALGLVAVAALAAALAGPARGRLARTVVRGIRRVADSVNAGDGGRAGETPGSPRISPGPGEGQTPAKPGTRAPPGA